MSTNVHPRVGGYVAGDVGRRCSASSPCTTGRDVDVTDVWCQRTQRQQAATTAPEGTIVSRSQCQRLVTSGGRYVNSRNVRGPQSQRAATTAWRDVSEPQRQSAATVSAPLRQSGATSARCSVRACNVGASLRQRQSAETSAWR